MHAMPLFNPPHPEHDMSPSNALPSRLCSSRFFSGSASPLRPRRKGKVFTANDGMLGNSASELRMHRVL